MSKSSQPPTNPKEASRFQWRLNHYIGLVLIVFIFIAVNYVGQKRYLRVNWSASQYTGITELTRNMVGALDQPIEVIHYISPQDDPLAGLIIGDVEKLLEEYSYHSNGKINVRKVDPYIDFELAREISQEFKVALQENVIIVKRGEQHKIIDYSELAQFDTGGMFGQSPPKVQAFTAEQAITSAIQSLAEQRKSVVYFLTGHGEFDPQSDPQDKLGLSLLASYVERQNAEVRKLNLAEESEVPSDADLLVIVGPRSPYAAHEVEMLSQWALSGKEGKGRLMVFLDPKQKSNLEDLLADQGIRFRDDTALIRVSLMGQVRLLAETIITTTAIHPSLSWINQKSINLGLGSTRTIAIEEPQDATAPVRAVALLKTPDAYWGETGKIDAEAEFDAASDVQGPLTIAALYDDGSVSGGQVNLQGNRVAVFGGASFLTNQSLQGGQLDLFINMMNWMLNKEKNIGIVPKIPEEFRVSLDNQQRQILSGVVVLLIPLLGLIAGGIVWFRRRR